MEKVQEPQEYKGTPELIRTRYDEFQYNSRGERRKQEVVDISEDEKNLLLYFMGVHAVKKLTPEKYLMYHLMWKYWGEIDRKSIFKLAGISISEPSDKDIVNYKLARSIGSRISDAACSIEGYLSTWTCPSFRRTSQACHEALRDLLPRMYKVSSKLLSNGRLTRHKNFNDAIVIATKLKDIVHILYDDQIMLVSTTKNHERRDWLNEMRSQVKLLKGSVLCIVGKTSTASLLFK
jgi:hypothetical protein